MEQWIQFTVLMLTFAGFLIRNEHRITLLEGEIKTEKAYRVMMEKRIDKLEARRP